MKARNIIQKYTWLLETIQRAGRISLNEINEKWMECSFSDGKPMPRSTFVDHRQAIQEMFGINIAFVRDNGYKYYIENEDDIQSSELMQWMTDTISIGQLLADSQQLHHRILLDEIPVGGYRLSEILHAMKENRQIAIQYRKFGAEPKRVQGSPLCIKAFNHRWYVVLDTPDHDEPAVYSLDRIKAIKMLKDKFQMPDDFDAKNYFHDSFGVFAGNRFKPENVILKVTGVQRDYMRSLPLHPSQKEIEHHDSWSIFQLRIRPTFDFRQELLSHGSAIQVLEPESLRKDMKEEILKMAEMYE